MDPWLSRLRHDLVKRAVWPARDLRDAGRAPDADAVFELRAGLFELRDSEGSSVTARELWEELRREAPPVSPAALDSFETSIAEAERAVAELATRMQSWREAVDAVLRIEAAFDELSKTLEEE